MRFTTTNTNLTDAANTNLSGTFTQANNSNGNYVVLSGINGTGFTLTATPGFASNGNARAPVNAESLSRAARNQPLPGLGSKV